MVEDKELQDLFRAESEEHLQRLDALLLKLESGKPDASVIEDAFREAHSLKGAARMVGAAQIEAIAHGMEETLGRVRKGEGALLPGLLERAAKELEEIKRLVCSAVPSAAAPKRPEAVDKEPVEVEAPGPRPAGPFIAEAGGYRIDTVRVKTKRLDELLSTAGELTVLKNRLSTRSNEAARTLELWEEVLKEAPGMRLSAKASSLGAALERLLGGAHEDSSTLSSLASSLEDGIRDLRLLPLSTLFNLFPRTVRDLSRAEGKDVRLVIEGGDTKADKLVIEEMKDALTHLVRNSVDHGIETPEARKKTGKPSVATVWIRAARTDSGVTIEVEDDGRGVDIEAVRKAALKSGLVEGKNNDWIDERKVLSMIFAPGISTSRTVTEVSGRGVGLDAVRAKAEGLKGTIEVESSQGRGTLFRIRLPLTLSTARVLLVRASGGVYALPADAVERSVLIDEKEVYQVEGRNTASIDGRPVPVVPLGDLLGIRAALSSPGDDGIKCVLMRAGGELLGMIVDELMGEQEVVLKEKDRLLKLSSMVTGATILGGGEVSMVLSPRELLRASAASAPVKAAPGKSPGKARKKVLLVEDSITTRTQEKRILEGGGYDVTTAVDGLDALGKLAGGPFDAVVSDIMMPNMDGLALTARIRKEKRYTDLPVILVTTLASEEDRKKGLDAGADAYIAKPAFDQALFLETLKRLV